MSPRPLIFISAVSQELRSARQLVANTLTFLGYDPIWQDIFETSEGDLRDAARRIGNAQARNGQDPESRQTSFLLTRGPSKNPTHGAIDP